jgi:hypothetical protein
VSDASFHSAFREETDKPRMPKVMGNLALVLGTGAVLFGILGMASGRVEPGSLLNWRR